MGCANVELEIDGLACSVRLDLVGVVGVLKPLTKPDVALCSVVVGLRGSDLEFALNVAIIVSFLIIVDLLATSSLETVTVRRVMLEWLTQTHAVPGIRALGEVMKP